jgi:hypothetical protein
MAKPAFPQDTRRCHGYVVGMAKYWELDHTRTINRMIERIHNLGLRSGWRDREAEGVSRNELLGLRVHGALDRKGLLADMRARGHDDEALKRLVG